MLQTAKLSTYSELINFLQHPTSSSELEAKELLNYIAKCVYEDSRNIKELNDNDNRGRDQTVINLALRSYYQLLEKYHLEDEYFNKLFELPITNEDLHRLKIIYAWLLTNQKNFDYESLLKQCVTAFNIAVRDNSDTLVIILRILNLLNKELPSSEPQIFLNDIYFCVQKTQPFIREETLELFRHCCKQKEQAFKYFQTMCNFWPWTNRYKYYLLSCILNLYSLREFLLNAELSSEDFFSGLRLSLSYKSLFTAGQYLITALNKQTNNSDLLNLSKDILLNGSIAEVNNFCSQWFSRIDDKDRLLSLIGDLPQSKSFLLHDNDAPDVFRLIKMFSIFSQNIFVCEKQYFFKISSLLLINCFDYDIESQLVIFKLIITYITNFPSEEVFAFVIEFLNKNKSIDDPRIRHNTLNMIPSIINHISKMLTSKSKENDNSEDAEAIIVSFFNSIHSFISVNLQSIDYQPKIFSLKLLEIIVKSLYAKDVQKTTKKCILSNNQKLGQFLISEKVVNKTDISQELISLLREPMSFDDVVDLAISILQLLETSIQDEMIRQCKENLCKNDIDECLLSSSYIRVGLQNLKTENQTKAVFNIFEYALTALQNQIESFKMDPLLSCKVENHLFGYINVLNEIIISQPKLVCKYFSTLLSISDHLVNMLLDMLNLRNLDNKQNAFAASFLDMDESLKLLVNNSSFKEIDNIEDCCKFLLFAIWLTLRACCELVTSIGLSLMAATDNCDNEILAFNKCLDINVAVLSRCRHKGAIESCGLFIGKLTKCVTSHPQANSETFERLYFILDTLLNVDQQVSTTRRGAGFSIMFLHIIKNERNQNRELLEYSLRKILKQFEYLKDDKLITNALSNDNVDLFESRGLHYLCVLVKDSELREAMTKYLTEILMATVLLIDHPDWTVCNAALQLFGSFVPKIVGQKQANELEDPLVWSSNEVTYFEIMVLLPNFCEHILKYCETQSSERNSTKSIILFLEFLSNVEHLCKSNYDDVEPNVDSLKRIRELMWQLMRHENEKIRKLSAICFVRAHEFRTELPESILKISEIYFQIKDENFFQGLTFAITEGIFKFQNDAKHILNAKEMNSFVNKLKINLNHNFILKGFTYYTMCKVLDLYLLIGIDSQPSSMCDLLEFQRNESTSRTHNVGYDDWLRKKMLITNAL